MGADLFSVQGKTALVTGGSRGIGFMIAEGFLRAGARVFISSRNAEACARAERQLGELGEVPATPADVNDAEHRRALGGRPGQVFRQGKPMTIKENR